MRKVWRILCAEKLIKPAIMRLLIYTLLIQAGLVFAFGNQAFAQETANAVNKAIKAGDATELGKYFNSTLDISLPDTDESMSKSHATQVMKSFFREYPPKSYKVNHTGSSREATKYIIGTYSSGSTSFKTYILLKNTDEKYLIVQLQFEEE